jgi:hypothetical protein
MNELHSHERQPHQGGEHFEPSQADQQQEEQRWDGPCHAGPKQAENCPTEERKQ